MRITVIILSVQRRLQPLLLKSQNQRRLKVVRPPMCGHLLVSGQLVAAWLLQLVPQLRAPVKGQNRVNQRRATQTAAKNSVAIEREMADLNKQYQTLRGELKVQLVQDRKHEKQQYETLVAEQLNL